MTALPIPLLPLIRSDFGLDYTQSGLVISAFSLAYGIGQLPAGWLTDRIGPRLLITISVCGVATAGLLIGLSQTYTMLIVLMALMGVLGGGYHPSAAPIISASVEPERRGRALGIHMIGGSASYFLAPLVAVGMASIWGWRGSFIGLAVPTIIFGIVFYVLLGRRLPSKKAEFKTVDSHAESPSASGRLRRLVILLVLSISTGAIVFSVMSFIPLFLIDHFGIAKETAGASIALIYSSGLWAGPLGGYFSDRWGRVPLLLAIGFIAGPAIYLLNLAPYGLGIGALLATIGVIIFIRVPVSEAYIADHTSVRNRSTILGIFYFSSIEGSSVITPAIGYLIDQLGFYPSFTIAGASLLAITLICSILLWSNRD